MKKTKQPESTSNSAADLIAASLLRYQPYLSASNFKKLVQETRQPLLPAIRANLLKVDPMQGINAWKQRYGWETIDIPYYKYGWQIKHSANPVSKTIEHHMGEYYIQDAASMLPAALFSIKAQSDQLILDMAASPGGKTTQLIDLTNDKSFIIANDANAKRLQALRIVLQKWSALNFVITGFPGEKIGDWYPETFDMILLDAPCSRENLRPSYSHPMHPISPGDRSRLSLHQLNLLISAFKALKPGGQLVYATCTLAPEEDEAILDSLIKTFSGSVKIQDVTKIRINAPGLSSFQGKVWHPDVKNALRLWPHILGTSGFFAAKIMKTAPLNQKPEAPPTRPFKSTGLTPLRSSDHQWLCQFFKNNYGFSMSTLFDSYEVELWRRGDIVFSIPVTYLKHFHSLPYHTLGMMLGKQISNRFIPSHEFVSRFGKDFLHGRLTIPDELITGWISGRDIRNPPTTGYDNGSIVVVQDSSGRNLGRGKILTKRIRNLLPTRTI